MLITSGVLMQFFQVYLKRLNDPVHFSFKLTLLISLLACPVLASAREWSFTTFLDGKEIGQHKFTLTESADRTVLSSVADFNVKILFINAYKYKHRANEEWKSDCLSRLNARTEENSDVSLVVGKKQNGRFDVEGPKGRLELPECPMTFAYWNPKMLSQKKLLNPQTGEWLDVNIRSLGRDNLEVRGRQVTAVRYRLTAPEMNIDLWYSPEEEWLGLESTTPEGYLITYKLR